MVRCTGIAKSDCVKPCEWTKSKGCNKEGKFDAIAAAIALPVNKKLTSYPLPAHKSFNSRIYAFLGFRDDNLKEIVEKHGNKVVYGIKENTTHIVYKKDKRIMDKVELSTLSKLTLLAFLTKYGFESKKNNKVKTSLPTPTPLLLKPISKFHCKYSLIDPNAPEILTKTKLITYDNYPLINIFNHAKAAIKGMFLDVKDNNIQSIITDMYYVSNEDLFIMPLIAKSDENHKDKKLHDIYGVEFKYNPNMKYKIKVDKNVIVLLQSYKEKPVKQLDVLSAIQKEYSDAVQIYHYTS